MTGIEMCVNSRTVWLIPHMNTDNKGSEALYNFLFGCLKLKCFVLVVLICLWVVSGNELMVKSVENHWPTIQKITIEIKEQRCQLNINLLAQNAPPC